MNKIYLSERTNTVLKEYLIQKNYDIIPIKGKASPVCRCIATHPDIYMCRLGLWKHSPLFLGDAEQLGNKYPFDTIYNAICTDKYFIHNLNYTHKDLLSSINEKTIKIHVNQGYTRCCCLPVTDDSFITSDCGIAKALREHGAQVLLIDKGHILLDGFDYGFIGGCAGHIFVDKKPAIIFNGNLSAHPQYNDIVSFIEQKKIDIVYFNDYTLEDIGSIIPCF